MRKNSGFSLLELIVTLGLFCIFSLLIFPLLKVSNTLNNSITKQSLFEKDSAKIISLIEKSIKDSNIIKGNYIGKEYVENGAIVLQYDKEIYLGLTENFFKNKTSKGNTLFLEYPVSDGKNIFYSFIIFRFYYGELQVIECKKINNEVYVENKNTILENIYGYFEKIENGIIIEMEILDSDFLKARSLKGYANFKKELKNRAFILIGTLILIVFILGNFLLGYRIIYRKGERLNSYFSTISIDSQVHNLQTLAYDELKRIDKEISSGNYQSGAEYIGFEENFNRVWLGNSKNSYSFNRYLLYRIRFNGKTCYKYGDGDNKNFKKIILVNLYSYPYTNNIVTIEMKKTLTNPKANNQVSLLAKVDIEYEKGNKNPLTPNSEKLKEFVVNFENSVVK